MLIRDITPRDYEDVAALTVAAYERIAAPGEWGPGSPRGGLSDGYRKELLSVADRAMHAVVVVAEDEGRVVGAVTYVPGRGPYAEFSDPDAAGIRMLAVHPDAQGRGIGEALIKECIERARRERRTRIILHTTDWMRAAIRLYERLGFRRSPGHDFSPAESICLLSYTLDL